MQRLYGKQENTARFFYDGFVYYIDGRTDLGVFRCCKRNDLKCRAIIYTESIYNLEAENLQFVNYHNHEGDPYLLLKENFLTELEVLSITIFDDLRAIYDTVIT